jgi:protein-S-isoprenylcysteine O-methyltransferase Ste14
MSANPDLSALLLFASFVLCISLSHVAWKSPNPPPKAPYKGAESPILDRPDPTRTIRIINIALGAYYCALLIFNGWPLQSSAPLGPSFPQFYLCPNRHLVSPSFFTWSAFTIVSQSAILFGAAIRLLCFRTLGPDFSFQLTMPGKLKTGGLYAWVQHPSYTGSILMLLGNLGYMFRSDGAQGCWIPPRLQGLAFWANGGVWFLDLAAIILGIRQRVQVEEGMLREKFGKDWVAWNKKTARFIPGVL